nr:SdrD B-like domain-containing protein [Planctomycetota bacterium]
SSLDVNGNGIVDEVEIDIDNDSVPDGRINAGSVFEDADNDGARDAGEPGVAGVTVTAYDVAANVVGTDVTDANGDWRIDDVATLTGVRFAFSGWASWMVPAFAGTDNGTAHQLVVGSALGTDFGLKARNLYNFDNPATPPRLATACFVTGQSAGQAATGIVSIRYDRTGGKQHDASIAEVGTVWGEAYEPVTQRLFTAAFLKRHSGLGALGMGGVYVVDYASPTRGVSQSFDLQGVVPSNGGAAIDLGTVTRTGGPDYEIPATPGINTDLDAFGKVGRRGFGDIDLSEDAQSLWLVNTHQRALVRIDISDPAVLPPAATVEQHLLDALPGVPAAPGGVLRPWGLAFHRGVGYLGVVASAETSQSAADLAGYVLSFDPENVAAGFQTELTIALDYNRERTWPGTFLTWRPWARTWADVTPSNAGNRVIGVWPQPAISDIAFADDGAMILDLMDISGHQLGHRQYQPVSGAALLNLAESVTGGDILRVCRINGAWVMEGDPACPTNDPGTGGAWLRSDDGPGNNGEFFWQDNFRGTHGELVTGGLAIWPGRGEVVTTIFDPFDIWSQGMEWMSTSTGLDTGRYEIVPRDGSQTYFGKGNGLGDLELIIEPAPVEIGNLVFADHNRNGIQDQGDEPLPGVTVRLWRGGAEIATTVTDADGKYVFNNTNVPGGLEASSTAYEIRIDLTDAGLLGGAPTVHDQGADDCADSDGDPTTNPGYVTLPVTTPGPGEALHCYDAGFVVRTGLSGVVFIDSDCDGVHEPEVGESPRAGVTVILCDALGAEIRRTTTDANGAYAFEVQSGDYRVKIPATEQDPGEALDGFTPAGGVTEMPVTMSGQDVTGISFGYCASASNIRLHFCGWWVDNQDRWVLDSIPVGDEVLTRQEAIDLLDNGNRLLDAGHSQAVGNVAGSIDMSYALAWALIGAKLNVAAGNDSTPVEDAIRAADQWFRDVGGISVGITRAHPRYAEGHALFKLLDGWNAGG